MKLQLNSLALAVTALLMASSATAGPKIALIGNMNMSKLQRTGGTDPTTQSAIGGGVLLEMGFTPFVGLEIGGIYMKRTYESASVVSTYPYIQMPLLFKLTLAKYLVIGGGGYAAMGIGTPTVGANNYEYGTGDLRRLDFGLEGAAGLNIPLVPGAALMAEARYLKGLQNISSSLTPGITDTWSDMQFLAGIKLGI